MEKPTKSNDTRVVNLGLDERGGVKVSLSTDLESNTAVGGLRVVDSLGASLNVTANAVVIAGREGVQVVQGVNGDSVLWGVVTNGTSITGDVPASDVVRSLGTNEEAIATKDSVGGEGRSLKETARISLYGNI